MELRNYLIIDGKPSLDFDMYISGDGTYLSPERSFEEVEVPGKNGIIYIYDDNYKNVDVKYSAWIAKIDDPDDVRKRMSDIRSFLLSRQDYFKLEDSYHPGEFRFAVFNSAIDPTMHASLEVSAFDLVFSCKPQRFLKKYYDIPVEITTTGTNFHNETYFKAKPLIRVYGTGNFKIGNISVTINSANSYTDFDCDLQEVYKDTLDTNCNGNVTLTNAQFPYLEPGDNNITFSGITKIVLYPRLFML